MSRSGGPPGSGPVRWLETPGGPAAAELAERWLAGELGVAATHDNPRRRLARLTLPDGGPVWLKQYRRGDAQRLRRLLGRAPADGEWRALRALHRAGVPAPRPLARGRLASGDDVLLLSHVDGAPLADALPAAPDARRRALSALGAVLRHLHQAGWVHGDLHHGNVLLAPAGPALVDLQQGLRSRRRSRRLEDLGRLDHSLAPLLSTPDRVRLRAAALGLERPFDRDARSALVAVAVASARRRRRHARSRLRRTLRSGRAFDTAAAGGGRGMRVRTLGQASLEQAVAAHAEALARDDGRVLERDGRSALSLLEIDGRGLVAKETPARGRLGALRDLARGSAGRRAWRGGHGLRVLAVPAPEPLAYLEWRRLGLPLRSLVLMERVEGAHGLHEALERGDAATRERALAALLRLVTRLHRLGATHRDLKASNVLVVAAGGGMEALPIDLEDVRFPRWLSDAARLETLAQLNASVSDALPSEQRRAWLARYLRVLPFGRSAAAVRSEVVARSRARRHRWRGEACDPEVPGLRRRPASPRSTGR